MARPKKADLEFYLNELPARYRKTVKWWIETDKVDRSNPLVDIARMYRREYQESLPGPKGKKAPAHVNRELATIARTITRLRDQLGPKASREVQRLLEGRLKNTHLSEWIAPTSLVDFAFLGPFGKRHYELTDLADTILAMRGGIQRKPHHYWLIRWTVARLRVGGKPRSHVLPIIQCIHRWASEGEPVSDEFGADYLETLWPPR